MCPMKKNGGRLWKTLRRSVQGLHAPMPTPGPFMNVMLFRRRDTYRSHRHVNGRAAICFDDALFCFVSRCAFLLQRDPSLRAFRVRPSYDKSWNSRENDLRLKGTQLSTRGKEMILCVVLISRFRDIPGPSSDTGRSVSSESLYYHGWGI